MSPIARNVLIASIAIFATVAGFVVANFDNQNRANQPEVSPGDARHAISQLLAMTLPDAGAVGQAFGQWKGQILVVNFWATWCAPCREEMPGFSRLQSKYATKGVQFVGIALDSADKVREYSSLTPVTYPLLIGGSALMPMIAELGNNAGGLPFTLIIGRDGTLFQTRLGIWKEAVLEAILADLVK